MFPSLKVLEAHALDVGRQEFKLAQSVVSVSVEAANQSSVVELF